MKPKHDHEILSDFLSPSVRERIIYEFSSPQKAIKALCRFSHSADAIINANLIYYKGTSFSDTIKSEIKNSVSECVVFSYEYQQGQLMTTDNALDYLIYDCFFAIAASEKWLVIKPEHEGGKGLFYILKKH